MFYQKNGFTIIEMIVAVAIISIMAVLILANYNQGRSQLSVDGVAQALMVDLRQAQSMALAGALTNGKYGGYGIYSVSTTQYDLFFNENIENNGCQKDGFEYSNSGSNGLLIKRVSLPNNITISFNNNNVNNVFFAPPQPKTCIGNDANNESMTISLTDNSSGAKKTITVTKNGVIEKGSN